MTTSVAAPTSSTLAVPADSLADPMIGDGLSKQTVANQGIFAALLLLLFAKKAGLQGGNGEDATQVRADPKESTKTKDQDPNAALAASLLAGALATLTALVQGSGASKPPPKGAVGGSDALALSLPSASPIPSNVVAAATAKVSQAQLAKSVPESLDVTIQTLATASVKPAQQAAAKVTPVVVPLDSPHPAEAALPASGGLPDTKKLMVSLARTDTTLLGAAEPAPSASATIATAGPPDTTKLMVPVVRTDTTLLGAAEPAPPASATIATAAPLLISIADKVSKDTQSASAEPVSAQATVNGANQVHAPVTSQGELARPATVAPVPVADQIQNQVTAHMDQLRQMGRVEVQLDLHPPELGRVQLHLAMEDGRLNVRMVVQDDAAKRVMDMQAEPLRVRFSEMGVSVGHFDVRREGGSPNQNQQPASEPSAQAIQTDKNGPVRLRKAYAQLVNSHALVDVMA